MDGDNVIIVNNDGVNVTITQEEIRVIKEASYISGVFASFQR